MTDSFERFIIWVIALGLMAYLQASLLAFLVFRSKSPTLPKLVMGGLALLWPVTSLFFLFRS